MKEQFKVPPAQMSPKRSDIFGLGEKQSKLNVSSQILFFEIKAKFQYQ
jgi:hypothetical protein